MASGAAVSGRVNSETMNESMWMCLQTLLIVMGVLHDVCVWDYSTGTMERKWVSVLRHPSPTHGHVPHPREVPQTPTPGPESPGCTLSFLRRHRKWSSRRRGRRPRCRLVVVTDVVTSWRRLGLSFVQSLIDTRFGGCPEQRGIIILVDVW